MNLSEGFKNCKETDSAAAREPTKPDESSEQMKPTLLNRLMTA